MLKKSTLTLPQYNPELIKWFKVLSSFLVGQGALQLLQLISGFVLIRWLSVEEYAQYSIAFAFQSTAQMLVEFGFSGAIIALVGSHIHDKSKIGKYIKAGQYYRNRFFLLIGGLCILIFPLLTSKNNWPVSTTVLLLICILLNLYFSGNVSYYTSPLTMHKKLGSLYQIQVKNGIIRVILLGLLYIISALNAWLAALTTSLLTIANGLAFRSKAKEYISEPTYSSPEIRKEMVEYIRPIMPGIIFAALQGQIMVFIISIFGESASIAEIGALSRLSQLYVILNTAGSILISPYFAQQKKEGLLKKYFYILGIALIISGTIVVLGYLFPEAVLWLIGERYQHLQSELILLLINSGLGFIIGILWNMNASKKWIYKWMPWVSIPGTLGIQIFCAWNMDLNSVSNVLLFSIITSLYVLANRLLVSAVGFRKLITT